MALGGRGVLAISDVPGHLVSLPPDAKCALILVGPKETTERLAARSVAEHSNLVIVCIDAITNLVQISLRDKKLDLDALLNALRGLLRRAALPPSERIAHFPTCAAPSHSDIDDGQPGERPLLRAAMEWVHAVLRNALPEPSATERDLPGFTLTTATIAGVMDSRMVQARPVVPAEVANADAALNRSLTEARAEAEPLAAAAQAFRLTQYEFRVMVMALAPELDVRYQRCMAFLLDDAARRVGTLGLFAALLGEPSAVRRQLAHAGNLARWRLLDGSPGALPTTDEPLRLDPAFGSWLLGERLALDHDPRVRRVMRLVAWPGASLFERQHERASSLVSTLQSRGNVQWLLFAGDDVSSWRALLELGSEQRRTIPIRIEASRFAGVHVTDVEESGVRLGRLARLSGRPLVLDTSSVDAGTLDDDMLRLLFAAIGGTGVRGGVICDDPARIVRLLGASACSVCDATFEPAAARAHPIQAAGKVLDIALDEHAAAMLAKRYPLPTDALEQATHLARARRLATDTEESRHQRLLAACRDVAAEGISRLADRIDPVYQLGDVVLPPDRARQLEDVVDSVRLSSKVLDEWQFRAQLPYGRGVSALFHGPSGTGKTMAAHGIAAALSIQLLRLDLSRVVSKYIGDTEKNIDRIFVDAHRCGAAILIDEADALLGKRSEVKDAHDRYANIEVAYLLQRMEAFEGLAILTTNMRQNLDPAFLRRLRFIVDFPRPDADAREKIWRKCLPGQSHALDDAAFRQLARKIELTGGHIRQISVRAAFTAAAEDSKIRLEHVAYASRAEFAKLGMPAVELELAPQRRAA
jgi:ATP-dependent 26S proteasome regulatory subunit